jgi:hypothetical protein
MLHIADDDACKGRAWSISFVWDDAHNEVLCIIKVMHTLNNKGKAAPRLRVGMH